MIVDRKLEMIIINIGFIPDTLINKSERYNINKYIKQGLMYSKNVILLGKTIKVYYGTDSYLNILREQGHYLYRSKVDQIKHDYMLCKIFLNLKEEYRKKWFNETFLKYKFEKEETTDAVFIKDDKLIAVEVITSSYSKDKIEKKNDFIKLHCNDSIVINTNGLKLIKKSKKR